MLYDPDRNKLRQMYIDAWQRFRAGQPLEPVQAQVAAVIQAHPEYQPLMERPDAVLDAEFPPELGQSNPFLHMGLHLAVRDQLATDRPAGIRQAYQRIAAAADSEHGAEHVVLECLAEFLWRSHQPGAQPDEREYLESVLKRAPAS